MIARTRSRKIAAMTSVLLLSAYATGSSEPENRCGVCATVPDYTSCWTQGFEYHIFNGLAPSGYEGFHVNDACGSCSSGHITCGLAAAEASDAFFAAAQQGENELTSVAAAYPKYVTVNGGAGTAMLSDCNGERVAVIELVHATATVVTATAL